MEMEEPPKSILILGAGVLGLSTLHALLTSPRYNDTDITIVDAYLPSPFPDSSSSPHTASKQHIPASFDVSRIIRPDYANKAYADLAAQAQELWRKGWPYHQNSIPTSDAENSISPSCSKALRTGNYAVGNCSSDREPVYYEQGLIVTVHANPTNSDGIKYYQSSLDNVQKLQKLHGGKPIQILQTAEEVDIAAGGSAKDMGSIGYLNPNSGWADASRAMEGLIYIITSLLPSRSSTVTWLHSQVSKLQFSRSTKSSSGFMVTGAVLETGEELQAELTILAMGSSASKLLPRSLGNRIRASGQVVAYVHVPAGEEAMKQRGRKVLLDLGTGLFSIPPAFSSTKKGQPTPETVLKVARHGWGYSHIVTVPDIEPLSTSTSIEEQNDSEVVRYGRKIAIHIPAPRSSPQSSFPLEADQTLREFLTSYAPSLAKEPWLETRICWYADTPSGDFLVDYIPAYGKSILVAGGGSGHGFKFLPVIGDYILQILERWLEGKADDENGENRDGEMGEEKRDDTEGLDEKLRKLWRWRKDSEVMEECWNRGDGSRGGRRGMKWDEEVQRKEVRLWI